MLSASRILAWTGVGLTQAQSLNLYWFRIFALMHAAGRNILTVLLRPADASQADRVLAVIICACFLGGLHPRFSSWSTRIVVLLVGLQIAVSLPFTPNHWFLEFICLAFLALLDGNDEQEGELLLQVLRWFTIMFFFYSGLQKVLYGYYFDGQFLGYIMVFDFIDGRFASFLRFFMPASEFERLMAIGPDLNNGDGPFSVDSTLFRIVSNGVYVFEMLVPMLLLIPRVRPLAAVFSIGFIIAIEAGARELVFGALMINLLLIFLDGAWIKRLFPLFSIMYAYLIAAAALEWVPMFEYIPN